jgi:hypothetical protein
MKLVKGQAHMSDEFRKGMWEGKKRIAGVTASEQSDDELLGLIFVFDTMLIGMVRKLEAQRREKRKNFKLELVN